jgi:hypothetical protein
MSDQQESEAVEDDGKQEYACVVRDTDGGVHVGVPLRMTDDEAQETADGLREVMDDKGGVLLKIKTGWMVVPHDSIVVISMERVPEPQPWHGGIDSRAVGSVVARHFDTPDLSGVRVYGGHAEDPAWMQQPRIGGPAGSGYETPLSQRG